MVAYEYYVECLFTEHRRDYVCVNSAPERNPAYVNDILRRENVRSVIAIVRDPALGTSVHKVTG